MTKASGSFKNMTVAQVGAWQTYAQTQTQRDAIDGKATKPTSMSAFMKLACKFLQVTPTGTAPLVPPTSAFDGDNITVTAVGALGKIVFTGSAKNTAGIVTELLVQQVANLHRKPQKGAYRSKGFTDFLGAGAVFNLTMPAGFYAVAYRFVNSATGQMVGMVPLGIVSVG